MCELISEIGEFEHAGLVSLGPVGVGKSSNLNTIASYLSNRLEQEAAAGSGASTLTISCRSHIISYQGRPVKWKWMDTPGDLFTTLVEKWKRTGTLYTAPHAAVHGNPNTPVPGSLHVSGY